MRGSPVTGRMKIPGGFATNGDRGLGDARLLPCRSHIEERSFVQQSVGCLRLGKDAIQPAFKTPGEIGATA